MITEEQVREGLNAVLVPGVMRSLVGLNMVRQVTVSDHEVSITLASTALSEEVQNWIEGEAKTGRKWGVGFGVM